MADRPKVPVSVTSEFPLFTLQFYENEEEEAVCHAFCDKYNLPNTLYSHLVSQVTAMHQQFLQTEEEESEWEKEDESYEEEEVEEYSEFDAPLPQKPLQQPDAGGEIINPFTPPLPPESFPQLKRGTLEAQEVRTRSDHTTQISQELTEKMEKEIAQQKYLEGTKKNRKERLDNERDEKEQSKPTFRKRIVLPSDEISPKKVTLEQNRIDSLTARLDHEAKERSKTARSDKKSHKIVEQKQRKRIDEIELESPKDVDAELQSRTKVSGHPCLDL
ncbi:hypothetical protein BLNAU_19480 [Blattamonas nauphoetae]|uniref:Uncharacterized protein n=1 Tax=Blattamonas nauphoetae TaxID=2049346 RepID=A0ABQ9X1D3_9EUKA|nr:hypothetical protein BLNAU_19480 [Blattamonas nauphoetae]